MAPKDDQQNILAVCIPSVRPERAEPTPETQESGPGFKSNGDSDRPKCILPPSELTSWTKNVESVQKTHFQTQLCQFKIVRADFVKSYKNNLNFI